MLRHYIVPADARSNRTESEERNHSFYDKYYHEYRLECCLCLSVSLFTHASLHSLFHSRNSRRRISGRPDFHFLSGSCKSMPEGASNGARLSPLRFRLFLACFFLDHKSSSSPLPPNSTWEDKKNKEKKKTRDTTNRGRQRASVERSIEQNAAG